MSRRADNKGRSNGEGRYVRLFHTFLRTEAWRSLDGTARAVYIEMAMASETASVVGRFIWRNVWGVVNDQGPVHRDDASK